MAGKGLPLPHEQCQATRRNGKRCRKYKLRGARTCEFHGGRSAQRARVETGRLPRFYSKVLAKTLTEYVEDALDASPDEAVSLYEELALMRHAAVAPIALYSHLVEEKKPAAAVMVAADAMRDALKEVADMCQRISQINASSKDKITVHTIEYVVKQIVRIIYENVPRAEAELIEQAIKSQVRLPKTGVEGTTITPDADVQAMDDLVPRLPHDES